MRSVASAGDSFLPQSVPTVGLYRWVIALLPLALSNVTSCSEVTSVRAASDEFQSTANQRRLAFDDLIYKGAFRLPAETVNEDSFAGGGQAVAFNPASLSLFVSSAKGNVAEVSIPTPAFSPEAVKLPVATFLQAFSDPTEGRMSEVGGSGVMLSSLLVYQGRLLGAASIYYDAENEQRVSHFARSLRLTDRTFRGWTQVWEQRKTGYVAGWLASVPAEWRQSLGGAIVAGQCCIPIITRTSWGPAAFALDPLAIGTPAAAATPLLYYSAEHPTLGSWQGSNERFGNSTEVGGAVIVDGTRSVLYFGRTGMGEACYGSGTADKKLVGTIGEDGAKYCFDPTSPYKGTHAYPYRYQIWAYDLNDLAAAKAGKRRPWDTEPYAVWPLEFPTPEPRTIMGGIGYDSAHRTIYVTQRHADRDEYQSRPVIHLYQVR
jgi:hypothetical protein